MTDTLPVHSTVTAVEPAQNNIKQRSILKRTCSKEHSENDSAPPAQKTRTEKEASSARILTASALVPNFHQNPASDVAAAVTAGNVVEVKRSHQKGASGNHQKKPLMTSQAVTLTLPDIRQPLSSTSSLSASLAPPNSQATTISVCSRVAQANILKSDPLTSIAYQTFSGTKTAICRCV